MSSNLGKVICTECEMSGGAHKLSCSRAPKPNGVLTSNERVADRAAHDQAWTSFANSEPAPTHKDCFHAGWVAGKGYARSQVETTSDLQQRINLALRVAKNKGPSEALDEVMEILAPEQYGPSEKATAPIPGIPGLSTAIRHGHPDCEKCHGYGWLRGRELDNAGVAEWDDTMTKYSCDGEKCQEMRRENGSSPTPEK